MSKSLFIIKLTTTKLLHTMSILTVKFSKGNDVAQKDIYIGFVSGSTTDPFDISYHAGELQPLEVEVLPLNAEKGKGNWYSLEKLQSGVQIKHFSGRIYISYGQPWEVLDAYYEPAQNITDPNFF